MGAEDAGKAKSEKEIRKLVRRSYYNKEKARKEYEDNKEEKIERGKKRWAAKTPEQKKEYYKTRKLKRRKLKNVSN